MESKMEIKEAMRNIKLRTWAEMVQACMVSGKTAKAWCGENGISMKTYYYRLKCVRLAAIQEPEKVSEFFPITGLSTTEVTSAFAELQFGGTEERMDTPDEPAAGTLALSVRMGSAVIDINNGACSSVIAATLYALREIC